MQVELIQIILIWLGLAILFFGTLVWLAVKDTATYKLLRRTQL